MKTTAILSVLALLLLVVFTSRNIVAEEDSDQDGLPDPWEIHYFGDLSQNAGDDPDLDGFTNIEEYNGGSDPTDIHSGPNPPIRETD